MVEQDTTVEHDDETDEDIMEMTTGVRLRLGVPSAMVINDLLMKASESEPKPPMLYSKDKERDEENPNDPDFLQRYRLWLSETGVRTFSALVVAGTTIEEVPNDMATPDSDEFEDYMAAIAIPLATGKHQRYLQWVKYVAVVHPDDQNHLTIALLRRAGVREEDVGEAHTMFRGDTELDGDSGPPVERSNRPDDPVPRRVRRARARDRGTRG